ncbi:hypothetical protein C8R45DRAFT_935708 [Mycena sanguinolenta]|nr:hypothetical protein C8R45DRAFT_935708 [Mycena sanguinolenta]
MRRVTANSRKVGVLGTSYDPVTRSLMAQKIQKLSRPAQDRYRQTGAAELELRLQNMPEDQLENFRALRDFSDSQAVDMGDDDNDMGHSFHNINDVLDGTIQMDVSHAGGEFIATLQDGIEKAVSKQRLLNPGRSHTEVGGRMESADGPAEADLGTPDSRAPTMVEEMKITVVDLYETSTMDVELNADGAGVAAALVKQGLIPCAPWTARCPQLAIQAFVKSLCDLHGMPYRPYLREQFSIAYDVYLELRRQTDKLVNSALGRDTPNWRMKHTCPACMYKLEGEDDLIFSMLTTMDGNESLKRVLRRSKTDGSEAEPTLGPSREREDSRDGGEDYFLTREQVDRWAKDRVADLLPTDAKNPCSDRWKNMINDITSRMWGIFDETGIFLALCRHGFVLVVADMVRSSELAKYPLAVANSLLDAFGLKIGDGYDIGCHFKATIANSELRDKARTNHFRSLVGSFHGHAHNRLCQLSFLATYVEGMGLEDLEGCERFFSRSNALAKSVRYASKFHRRQEITTFMKQTDDLETYANLSKFLCDNYQQALKIIRTEPDLKRWMAVEGIEDVDTFHVWLEEERDYLTGMEDGLPKKREETVEMEYVKRLKKLLGSQERLSAILKAERAVLADGADFNPAPISQVAQRHAVEQRNRDLDVVQGLESKLGIEQRWTSESPEWILAEKAIKEHRYLDALDEIERIIVERLFEMTKIHQSGTGYKMRSHIAKALQARSKAVRNAINRYNAVAEDMVPPKPTLSWEEVVNYAFLSEFDILRDTQDGIQSRPWTRRSYRLAMDRYFKILRAQEEIKRLNIEIKRVKEEEFRKSDPFLAVQISRYRQRRSRSDDDHMQRFWALAKTPGLTGSVSPGVSIEKKEARRSMRETRTQAGTDMEMEEVEVEERDRWTTSEQEWEDDDDEGEEAKLEAVSTLLYQMPVLSVDCDDGRGSHRLD